MKDKGRKDKRHVASAIKYSPSPDRPREAPRVTATGKGAIAHKMLEIARKNNVPISYNPPLAEALAQIDLMAEIPPDLYSVVAEIITTVCDAESKFKGMK